MNPSPSEPRVSCLCVTRHRPRELRRSILSFLHQTYANKELSIVYETDDIETAAVVEEFGHRSEIVGRVVPASPKLTLGELRNFAIDGAAGEYFCQWDDDDWYHVGRIEAQMATLRSTHQDACVLTNWLMFDTSTGRAYFSHFRLWEGSIVCRRAAIQSVVRYPALSKMEDSFFMNALIARCRVVPMLAPHLYLYVMHQKNTWDRYHRQVMLKSSQPLSESASRVFSDVLSGHYSPEEASERLGSSELARELNYLHVNTLTPTDEQLHRYRQTMERVTSPKAPPSGLVRC